MTADAMRNGGEAHRRAVLTRGCCHTDGCPPSDSSISAGSYQTASTLGRMMMPYVATATGTFGSRVLKHCKDSGKPTSARGCTPRPGRSTSRLLSLECSGPEGLNPISAGLRRSCGARIGSGGGRCSLSVWSTASGAHSPIVRAILLLLSAPMVAVDGAKPPGLPLCLVN